MAPLPTLQAKVDRIRRSNPRMPVTSAARALRLEL